MVENNRLRKQWQSGQKYRYVAVLTDLILSENNATKQKRQTDKFLSQDQDKRILNLHPFILFLWLILLQNEKKKVSLFVPWFSFLFIMAIV